MIELKASGGFPMHIEPENIIAFGRRDLHNVQSVKSWILVSGQPHEWELETEYDELQRLIWEAKKPDVRTNQDRFGNEQL